MAEEILKFDNIRVNKKKFHKSKESIDLKSVNVDQIVVSDKFKHSDDGFKYFLGLVLSIFLVTKMVKFLNRCVLSYLK